MNTNLSTSDIENADISNLNEWMLLDNLIYRFRTDVVTYEIMVKYHLNATPMISSCCDLYCYPTDCKGRNGFTRRFISLNKSLYDCLDSATEDYLTERYTRYD